MSPTESGMCNIGMCNIRICHEILPGNIGIRNMTARDAQNRKEIATSRKMSPTRTAI